MKKRCLLFAAFIMLSFSCKHSNSTNNEGDYYDKFRGDQSSIINLTQYESFLKCTNEFDFSNYENNKITLSINAPNDFVYDQINIIIKNKLLEKNIQVVTPEYNDGKRIDKKTGKYDLQFNAICGGYYFYDGFIRKIYKSITRMTLIENNMENEKKISYDSGYQEYKYNGLEFTDFFKLFIYSLFLTLFIIIFIVILKKMNIHENNK